MENAIREGIIYWHAFPYNGQLEIMDERHVRENLQLTHDLDAKFGYKPKITLSQVYTHRIELRSTHVFHVADGELLCPNCVPRGLSAVMMWCSACPACMQRGMPVMLRDAIPILIDGRGLPSGPFTRPKLVHCLLAEGCPRLDKERHPHFDR